jgi:hypothetical protein
MPRFLISFDDGSMDHIADDDLVAVGEATRAVMRDAKAAGVWIFGAGLQRQQATVVQVDGSMADGPPHDVKPGLGGFVIVEVADRDEALRWAAMFAASCDCAQEVREIMFDPES